MRNREWEQEYETLLEEGRKRGEVDMLPAGDEQRAFPRFRLQSGEVWIRMDLSFDVVDVSVAGISFFSTQVFKPKQVLAVTLGKAFRIEAEVLDCEQVEADRAFMEIRYLVRCQFLDQSSSVRFLVLLKEYNDSKIAVDLR